MARLDSLSKFSAATFIKIFVYISCGILLYLTIQFYISGPVAIESSKIQSETQVSTKADFVNFLDIYIVQHKKEKEEELTKDGTKAGTTPAPGSVSMDLHYDIPKHILDTYRSKKAHEGAKKCFKTLLDYGYSPAAAVGVIANTASENMGNAGKYEQNGDYLYYGAFCYQVGNREFHKKIIKAGYNPNDALDELKYFYKYVPGFNGTWSGFTVSRLAKPDNPDKDKDYKDITNPEIAAEAFCVIFERAVTGRLTEKGNPNPNWWDPGDPIKKGTTHYRDGESKYYDTQVRSAPCKYYDPMIMYPSSWKKYGLVKGKDEIRMQDIAKRRYLGKVYWELLKEDFGEVFPSGDGSSSVGGSAPKYDGSDNVVFWGDSRTGNIGLSLGGKQLSSKKYGTGTARTFQKAKEGITVIQNDGGGYGFMKKSWDDTPGGVYSVKSVLSTDKQNKIISWFGVNDTNNYKKYADFYNSLKLPANTTLYVVPITYKKDKSNKKQCDTFNNYMKKNAKNYTFLDIGSQLPLPDEGDGVHYKATGAGQVRDAALKAVGR